MDQQDQLAKMMAKFGDNMMKKIRAEFSPGGAPAVASTTPKEVPSSGGSSVKYWYAVINGKGGVNSVFPEWIGGAAPYVTGVSGALSKKFSNFNEAWAHVELHVATAKRLGEEEAKVIKAWTEAMADLHVDLAKSPAPMVKYPQPPLSLTGPNPSMKKEDELFEFEYGSEMEVRASMCPPGMGPDHAKILANSVVDVVALPGGFTGGNDEKEGSDLAMTSAALEELVQQGRSSNESTMKSDLQWRSGKRTGLRSIKSLTDLTKRFKDLLKLCNCVIKNMIKATVNALKQASWTNMEAINAWDVRGYFMKMLCNTMDAWIALHQHLLGLAITENVPWAYVQVEINHHVEELELLRNAQDSRLQALCANYIYVRDGHAGSWLSTALQNKRNAEIFTKVAESDYCKLYSNNNNS
jgi:hypothetical protein